ncbi:twin-arginine translocation signal domain-containing protein [Bradyrhizobium guangdongense]
MERRNFLKLAFGVAAGAAALTAAVQAVPLAPQPLGDVGLPQGHPEVHPAVTTSEEAAQLKPEQVHWHGRHWGWHHRHWGWRHRHWGWRHRWHRHHWRHW